MTHARKMLILVLLWSGLLAASSGPALATYPDACSATEAKARVSHAERDLARAEARLREARHVLGATRYYSGQYGNGVGRWVWLARHVRWPWGQFPTLFMVISRESGGDPAAKNPVSTASGLMQFLSSWYEGCFDPFNPHANLLHGRKAWQASGWQPWGM